MRANYRCAEAYRKFCKKYNPQPKSEKRSYWGSKKLANLRGYLKSVRYLYTSPPAPQFWGVLRFSKSPRMGDLGGEWRAPKLLRHPLKLKKKSDKTSPGQRSLWEDWNSPDEAIRQVAEKFVLANCFDPKIASQQFEGSRLEEDEKNGPVPGIESPE